MKIIIARHRSDSECPEHMKDPPTSSVCPVNRLKISNIQNFTNNYLTDSDFYMSIKHNL